MSDLYIRPDVNGREWECERSANLFDEPLGKGPMNPQNQFLSIVLCWQGVPEILFEPSQHWSPKPQRSLDLIICNTLDLLRRMYSARFPWESLCKHINYHPQHDQVWSACVGNP